MHKSKGQSATNLKLNKEFDDLRLPVKWAIEDMLEKIHQFEPIFTDAKTAKRVKAEFEAMLAKVSKL